MAFMRAKHCARRCENIWIVIATIFVCLVRCSDSFNIDTQNFVKHSGTPGSMFGFSVAEHKERGRNWVLIGAPEAQTRQPGVTKGGAVFRCEVDTDDACEEILFDSTGNNNNTDGRQIDKKSNQWFGATVRSSGETGIVLACAPRYVWFSTTTAYRRDPVGTCYIAKNYFSEFSEYSPCRTRNWGYHRQGSCQAGLGADVSKDGNRLYVGAPGSWYWQGQIYDISSAFKMPTISPDYSKNYELNLIEYESGQLYAQNPNKRPEVLATSEGSPQDDDSYLGYSVAAGDFDGRGEGGVAVGMPRGAGLFGKVVLYSKNLTNLQNLTGQQLGSYFSYSLAVVDVDGDRLDDVIVGAPLHTDLNNNEGKYETGRVYIYFQEPRMDDYGYYTRFSKFEFRDGKNSKGRFGLSVASLNDVNKDGFGDFAVGAPYDGKEGRGAVYIYHGKRGGVREAYSQVIKAEDLSVPTSTFGFSIAGGLDMDNNQYPDMVVGAYDSDTSIFFRSRPVVRMVDARVSFMSKTKQISLDDQNCTLRDYTKAPCIYLQACLKYDGVEVDRQIDIDLGVTLDSKKPKTPRMFFVDEEGKNVRNDTMRLLKGESNCKSYYVYVKPNIRDKLTPLEAELRYNLKNAAQGASGGRRYTRSLSPVLDANELNIQKDSLSIQKNCGPDNICIPDLQVITKKSVSKYLLGSGERFSLDVQVENKGEDAFEAMYNLQVPPGMNYINIERLDSDRSIPVQCSAPGPMTNNTLKCDIGNPLPKEKMVHFKVLLQPFHREGMKSSYNFVSAVNSTNPEDELTATDNIEVFTVPIWVETDLILQGSSHPPDIHYNMSHYEGDIRHENDIGPQVFHVYNIRNKGPSDILEAQTIFLWPSYTLSGDHFLYLLEQPETNGNVKCEYVENANEEGIELDRKRKSFLDSAAFSAAQLSGQALGKGSGRANTYDEKWGWSRQEGWESHSSGKASGSSGGWSKAGGHGAGSLGGGHAGGSFSGSHAGGSVSRGRGGSWSHGGGHVEGSFGSGHGRGTFSKSHAEGSASGGYAVGSSGEGYASGGRAEGSFSNVGSGRVSLEGARSGGSWKKENTFRGGATGSRRIWSSRGGGGGTGGSHWESSQGRGVGTGGSRWESSQSGSVSQGESASRGGHADSSTWEHSSKHEENYLEGKGQAADFESGDGSVIHRTRVQGKTTFRKYEGQDGTQGGNVRFSGGNLGKDGNYITSSSRGGFRVTSDEMETSKSSSGSTFRFKTDQDLNAGREKVSSGISSSTSNGRVVGGVSGSGGSVAWSESAGGSTSLTGSSGNVYKHKVKEGEDSSEEKNLEWGVDASGRGKARTEDEKRIQQKPLVFNATGYSRARGKVETNMNKNLSDGTLRKAYGQNEFRTVSLDLGPSQGSNIGLNIVGGGVGRDELSGTKVVSIRPEVRIDENVPLHVIRTEENVRTREYEDAINRELEKKRLEAEKAAAASAVAASGFKVDTKKFETHDGTTSEESLSTDYTESKLDTTRTDKEKVRTQVYYPPNVGSTHTAHSGVFTQDHQVYGSNEDYGREIQRKQQETDSVSYPERTSGGTRTYQVQGTRLGNGTRTYKILSNGTTVYETHYDGLREGSKNYEYEDALNREYERRRQEAEAAAKVAAAAAAAAASATAATAYDSESRRLKEKNAHGGRIYTSSGQFHTSGSQIHTSGGQVHTSGDQVRTSGGQVHTSGDQVRTSGGQIYTSGGQAHTSGGQVHTSGGQVYTSGGQAHTSGGQVHTSGGQVYTSGDRIHFSGGQIYGSGDQDFDLRQHEEALRREYEIKRQEAEAAAKELERIRIESEAGGSASYNPRVYETIEALRNEYEKKRLEAEAAAAAAAAAAQARSTGASSHQYSTQYQYRINSTSNTEGQPRVSSSGQWYVNNNGTVHSGSSGYDSDYVRNLQSFHEKRLLDETARRLEEEKLRASANYFNSSYFDSQRRSHDSTIDRNIDPDLGYVRTREASDYDGKSESRYFRTWEKPLNENSDENLNIVKNYDNVYERSKRNPTLVTRYVRQVSDFDLKSSLSCGPTNCTKIRCTVGPLKKGQEAWVALRGRVWVETLNKIGYQREVVLSSLMASQVTKLPHIGEPHNAKIETYEVFSEVMPQDVAVKPEVAPLWVIVLSACAGTLILLLLIFLLWKLGFFKRNRPSDAPEKQPLNRNGYQAGDEQL